MATCLQKYSNSQGFEISYFKHFEISIYQKNVNKWAVWLENNKIKRRLLKQQWAGGKKGGGGGWYDGAQ